jgi:sialidase-1
MLFGWGNTPFRFGNAWQFDGVNDFVSVPDAASLNFGAGNFSVSTWVRLNNTGLAQSIVAKRVGSGAGWFCFINQLGAAFLTVSNALISRQLSTANGVFAFGVWQHLVFIRNGGTLNDWAIYVNGVNVRSLSANTDPGLIIDNAQPLRLMSNNSGDWCSGSMDETLIYNRALTPTEVATLYNGGAGGFPPASAMGNLVARYSFDSADPIGPNFILIDSSGNNNNGTSSGISVSPLVPH